MRRYIKQNTRDIRFNTTALPDIVFMLLFFFMVVTVMKEDNITSTIDLPYTQYADYVKGQDKVIRLGIEMDNEAEKINYYVDNKRYQNLKSVENHIIKLRTDYITATKLSVHIKIDKNTSMRHVNDIKSILQNNHLYKVKYITSSKK